MNRYLFSTVFGLLIILTVIVAGCCRISPKNTLQLPIISIQTDCDILWDKRTPCSVIVLSNGDSFELSGKIKFRGGISSKYPKHSYSLKLKEKFPLCDLPANKSWVLNASYIDKTFMRHKLCYDLFREMGEYNAAPLCSYALVRENGSPQGLYVIMQRLNKQTLNIDSQDESAFIFKEPKIFFADSVMPQKSPTDLNFHEQTYPDFEKYGDRSSIVDDFHRFIISSSDEQFSSEIGMWIDIRNVLDWHLFILFTNNGDGVRKNFYLYKKNSETPFRIALWDCDHSLGRDGDNELNMLKTLPKDNRNILFDRLLCQEWYLKMMKNRWKQLRESGVFSYQNIEKMINENDPYVKAGLQENSKLWPVESKYYYDNNDYEQEKALILEFVQMNLDRLDERFR